jgi:hypothetical protein
LRRSDIAGKIFGRLTAVEFGYIKNGLVFWKCICSCGTKTFVHCSNLKRGHTRSCGCIQKETVVPESEREIRKKDKQYRRTEKYKRFKDEIWEEFKYKCFICNAQLKKELGTRKGGGHVAHLTSLCELNFDLKKFHEKVNVMLLCHKCHRSFDILKGEVRCAGPNAHKGENL